MNSHWKSFTQNKDLLSLLSLLEKVASMNFAENMLAKLPLEHLFDNVLLDPKYLQLYLSFDPRTSRFWPIQLTYLYIELF